MNARARFLIGCYLAAVVLAGLTVGALALSLDPDYEVPWWTAPVFAVALVAEGMAVRLSLRELKSHLRR
jgi:hypothetical protein